MKLIRMSDVAAWGMAAALLAGDGLGQNLVSSGPMAAAPTVRLSLRQAEMVVRPFPKANLGTKLELKYVGSYCPDGGFRAVSTRNRLSGGMVWRSQEGQWPLSRPPEVPPSVQLKSEGRIVQDFEPPAHALGASKGRSTIVEGRDALLRFVYGREWILRTPRHIATDSNERLIISDPAVPAVTVLDRRGRGTFRILGGLGRRIRMPAGVAVDGANNIYVADSERGVVLVYAPDGNFVRMIGDLGGHEGLFRHPTSISIAPKAGRLYVLDERRLFTLDLAGNVLKRIGSSRGDSEELSNAQDLVFSGQELFVLDSGGERVQVFDVDCTFLRTVELRSAPNAAEATIAIDTDGDLFVNSSGASIISVFDRFGAPVGAFGGWGTRMGEFSSPAGVWFDSHHRVYVADGGNVRVQVFQLSPR